MEVTEKTGIIGENRAIEKLLSYSALAIEATWGLQHLNRYLSELTLLSSGIPYTALGISERRHASRQITVLSAGQPITDRYILNNERLTPPGSIALLQLSGVMTAADEISSDGVQSLARNLRAAYANQNVDAIIIETNSGGGEVTAMQILVGAIQERNKPVIGWGHFAASAAYGALAATDEIVASNKMAEFGSIGAVITLDKTFLEFYKENYLQFYGEGAPLKNKAFRAALEGDFGPMRQVADKATDDFQAQVSGMRSLNGGEAYRKATLSGDTFDAAESRRRGLVDGVGNLQYAVARAEAWAMKYKQKRKRA